MTMETSAELPIDAAPDGALYVGTVTHRRLRPREHRLGYKVYSLYADLDRLPDLDRRLKLFSYNRPNVFSFYDRDHGDGTEGTDGASGEERPLRAWVDRNLRDAGIDLSGGPVYVLCFPRVLGYAFNPLTVYFCHRREGALAAVLYEVHNTFGERHSYLIPVDDPAAPVIRQACDKGFYVSPFIGMEAQYRFRLLPPDERLAVVIDQTDAAGPLLKASLVARRQPLTDRRLAAAFVQFPLVTLKVIAGIHWEALAIWLKGARYHQHSKTPGHAVTIVAGGPDTQSVTR